MITMLCFLSFHCSLPSAVFWFQYLLIFLFNIIIMREFRMAVCQPCTYIEILRIYLYLRPQTPLLTFCAPDNGLRQNRWWFYCTFVDDRCNESLKRHWETGEYAMSWGKELLRGNIRISITLSLSYLSVFLAALAVY